MKSTPRDQPDALRSPMRRREFRLYFVGNLISNIGNWVNHIALAVFMRQVSGSSLWVGVVGFGLTMPVLLFALPAGTAADRYDRLRLLLVSQYGLAVLAIAETALVFTGLANRWVLAAIALGFGFGTACAIPAMQALIPALVPPEELPDALRLNALTFNGARALGPLLAGGLLIAFGPAWAFGVNAASFVALIWVLRRMGPAPFPRAADGVPGPGREALSYAWRHVPTRSMLFAIVAIGIALDPITTLSPALAEGFGFPSSGASWIVASWGAGAVLMILAGARAIRGATEHGLGWIGLVALALGMVGLGSAPGLGQAMVAGLITGAGYITATMAFTTSIQRSVPEALRGRVMALWTIAFLGPRAFASLIDGAIADAVGAHWATAVFGLVALVCAVFMRRVETSDAEPVLPPA